MRTAASPQAKRIAGPGFGLNRIESKRGTGVRAWLLGKPRFHSPAFSQPKGKPTPDLAGDFANVTGHATTPAACSSGPMDAVEAEADGNDPMELLHVKRHGERESFTRYRLQETLMLMGCRPKDAVVVTQEVFAVFHKHLAKHGSSNSLLSNNSEEDAVDDERVKREAEEEKLPVALPWHHLHQCIYSSLARLDYVKPHHLLDFQVAKEITQRNQSFAVLLGGTSGTGKSTLASLLAARLRLTTVLPTDSVRHVLRAFTSKEENPCAFVSTYQAGDALSPEAVAALQGEREEMSAHRLHKRTVLRGYKMQSDVVLEKLDRVLTMFEERHQSLVVEGIGKMVMLSREHENSIKKAWSSKGVRKAMRPLIKQKVSKRLLLRRLLAEQTMATFGASDPHHGEDSSSSEEDEEEETAHEADDERNAEEDDDEQTTVVGSLFSGTNARDHAATAGQASPSRVQQGPTQASTPTRTSTQKRVFLDEIEEHAAGTSDNAKMMRSLSAAIRQAALWRASQPLTSYTDWETLVPPRSPEVTFSDVMEDIQATPGFAAAVAMGGKQATW
ncbi:hypothetical protein BBJ28_00023078, partial [Nothophytophthora sp. Chile5]